MKGIKYLVDDSGEKSAVVIDLKHHADLWEDFYDNLIADERREEPRESLENVRQRLIKTGKLKTHGRSRKILA